MLGKVVVQGVSGLLLLGAVTMFVSGVQAGALRHQSAGQAPLVATATEAAPQTAPLVLF